MKAVLQQLYLYSQSRVLLIGAFYDIVYSVKDYRLSRSRIKNIFSIFPSEPRLKTLLYNIIAPLFIKLEDLTLVTHEPRHTHEAQAYPQSPGAHSSLVTHPSLVIHPSLVTAREPGHDPTDAAILFRLARAWACRCTSTSGCPKILNASPCA